MPTYEYACRSCGHTFEIVQSMTDDPMTVCPKCEGELRKVFAPPAIAFKGSGFYATDHGKKSKSSESADKGQKKDGAKDDAAKDGGKGGASSSSSEPSSSSSGSSGSSGSSTGGAGSTKKEETST